VKQLKAEIEDLRGAVASPSERDAARISELERLVSDANDEIHRRAERLQAVEDQVTQAVGKLQQAHVDLHDQTELARIRADIIYQIERALEANGEAPAETLEKVKALLAPRS
jgi:chromosome segregation ATPase